MPHFLIESDNIVDNKIINIVGFLSAEGCPLLRGDESFPPRRRELLSAMGRAFLYTRQR
jgi:hypothetical protein